MESTYIYVLDIGNTAIKIALFQHGKIQSLERVTENELNKLDWHGKKIVVANVSSFELINTLKKNGANILEINTECSSSFISNYQTIGSLGIDRFCNVEAMAISGVKGNLLCVDIGTCIKFDFLDSNLKYQGGSISPGIDLRLKSLHDYTSRLPLALKSTCKTLIGNSTQGSILTGVMKGVEAEITKLMEWYESEFGNLTIFMTGGDASYFEFHQKSNIFADENLTLKGIYSIYSKHAY